MLTILQHRLIVVLLDLRIIVYHYCPIHECLNDTYASRKTNLHGDVIVRADDDELGGDVSRTNVVERVRIVKGNLPRNY